MMMMQNTMTKVLAPDDIRTGDYVVVLSVVHESFPMLYEDGLDAHSRSLKVRTTSAPEGQPSVLRVAGVCVPLVLVAEANGKPRLLDTRREQLGRLNETFGELAFEQLGSKAKKKHKKAPDDPRTEA